MSRPDPIKRMIDSRRLYRLESDLYGHHPFEPITKQLSIDTLRRLGRFIWKQERSKQNPPVIKFGKGVMHAGEYYSWCDGDTIELAPTQRDKLTLIHELVHALGYDDHDERFIKRYRKLLKKYAPVESDLIDEKFEELEKE